MFVVVVCGWLLLKRGLVSVSGRCLLLGAADVEEARRIVKEKFAGRTEWQLDSVLKTVVMIEREDVVERLACSGDVRLWDGSYCGWDGHGAEMAESDVDAVGDDTDGTDYTED
jgi:hypothetical protein